MERSLKQQNKQSQDKVSEDNWNKDYKRAKLGKSIMIFNIHQQCERHIKPCS